MGSRGLPWADSKRPVRFGRNGKQRVGLRRFGLAVKVGTARVRLGAEWSAKDAMGRNGKYRCREDALVWKGSDGPQRLGIQGGEWTSLAA